MRSKQEIMSPTDKFLSYESISSDDLDNFFKNEIYRSGTDDEVEEANTINNSSEVL